MSTGLDTSQFQAALNSYLPKVPASLAETLNKKLFYIARGASRLTPVSQRVEHDVGVLAYTTTRSRKTGKTKKGKAVFGIGTGNRFAMIINARRAKAGLPGIPKADMAGAVKRLIAARLRSKGTEKAGWIGAIRKLARAVGESSFSPDRVSVTNKSLATVAKDGWTPSADLTYRIISTTTNRKQYIDPDTEKALQTAFNDEARSMLEFLAKRMQKDADKINAK